MAFEREKTDRTATGSAALALLEPDASSNLAPDVIRRRVHEVLDEVGDRQAAIRAFANERALKLQEDHDRLTEAARGGATTAVEAVIPPDIIGLYVLLPEAL